MTRGGYSGYVHVAESDISNRSVLHVAAGRRPGSLVSGLFLMLLAVGPKTIPGHITFVEPIKYH